ncbi:MAG: hypothetical protein L0Z50_25055 [Verrucomicrobiales bacterium]|nr:hypothetical protein [Verrucomicrobiales bacterium]
MNILVIPEDFRKDQFILQPIIAAMMTKLAKPSIVEVLKDPLIGGVEQALNLELLKEIVDANRWRVDLFLLCVDRDAVITRRGVLDRIERHFAGVLADSKLLASENAWQELEVWLLAGHDLLGGWQWSDIRQHRDPKEAYFDELVRVRKLEDDPGGGRKTLGYEAARKYRRIYSRCREDIQVMEKRIQRWVNEGVVLTWEQADAELRA